MPVIGGALANWQVTSGGKISALEFATALFNAGAAGYMDAISIHPYPQTFTPLDHTIFQPRDRARCGRRGRRSAPRTPIWLTELGVSTTGLERDLRVRPGERPLGHRQLADDPARHRGVLRPRLDRARPERRQRRDGLRADAREPRRRSPPSRLTRRCGAPWPPLRPAHGTRTRAGIRADLADWHGCSCGGPAARAARSGAGNRRRSPATGAGPDSSTPTTSPRGNPLGAVAKRLGDPHAAARPQAAGDRSDAALTRPSSMRPD